MKYTDDQIADIGEEIIKELKTVYDPEIPVDIYELGLFMMFRFPMKEKF
jgi:metal-sulfur cluster biosynthetic enzyme